ncbi:PstS family phosphate ABC transporter substrate-binding protein [candidate division WOR-3 bacterium]|nr:PstS family phosphate ABC transporter substrate-binding protein [candidate division WOR-3 bacterium]
MKKFLIGLFVIIIIITVGIIINNGRKQEIGKDGTLSGRITMSGAWALYPMAVKWAEEFQKIHPNVKIDIAAGGAGKGMADALAEIVDIGNISRDIYDAEIEKGAWFVAVTKDAVVPTINESNPFIDKLRKNGISRDMFINIWITESINNWEQALSMIDITTGKNKIHVYTRSDACGAAETWAKYLNKHQDDLMGIGVYGDPGLAEAVKKDNLGIGYNNINYAYDAETKEQISGIRVLPIDINGNGKIDEDENFYSNRDDIINAISNGKYPSPPARDLYFVCQGKPERKIVIEFIKWVLTDGQEFVSEAGYIHLTEDKIKEAIKAIEDN